VALPLLLFTTVVIYLLTLFVDGRCSPNLAPLLLAFARYLRELPFQTPSLVTDCSSSAHAALLRSLLLEDVLVHLAHSILVHWRYIVPLPLMDSVCSVCWTILHLPLYCPLGQPHPTTCPTHTQRKITRPSHPTGTHILEPTSLHTPCPHTHYSHYTHLHGSLPLSYSDTAAPQLVCYIPIDRSIYGHIHCYGFILLPLLYSILLSYYQHCLLCSDVHLLPILICCFQ